MAGRFALGALRAVALAELRSRWRGLVGLGVLLGLAGGIVLGAVVVAQRTATAYPRLVEAVGLDDARVLLPTDREQLLAALPELPGVTGVRTAGTWVAQLDGPALRYVSVNAGAAEPADLVRPVVVAGREPAADAPDELLIGEPLAEDAGLGVGDEVVLRLLTPGEIGMFGAGFGAPDGPTLRMRVVGVGRMPVWGDGLAQALAGPAFAAAHPSEQGAVAAFVRLRDRAEGTRVAFAAAYTAAAAADPSVQALAAYTSERPAFPAAAVPPAVRTAERVLVGGLGVFATVLGLGGLVVVGQSLQRLQALRRPAQRVEEALGMTRGERVAARVVAATVGAVPAAVLGAGLALAAGLLAPLGSQARLEAEPGFRPSWAIAVGGGIGLAVGFAVLAGIAALVVGGRGPRAAAPLRPGGQPLRGGGRPAVVVGARLAWRGCTVARGPALPAAATVLGAAVVIAGVVATIAFGASLDRLVTEPSRYGQAADLTLVDAREPDLAALAADERVAALTRVDSVTVAVAGRPTTFSAYQHRRGAVPVEVVDGRPPERVGEVALGPRTAALLDAAPGDVIEVPGRTAPVRLFVTGIAVPQAGSGAPLGEGALVTRPQLSAVGSGQPLVSAQIEARPGLAGELFADLSRRLEVFAAEVPDEIRSLDELGGLPAALAGVLALVTAAGVTHALLTSGRRHQRDLAVLAVLGATPGQVRATRATMAVAIVGPALLAGVPLGLLTARVLWWEVAAGVGVAGDLAVPWPAVAAVLPVGLLGALLVTGVQSVRAARTAPARVLGGE